MSHKSELTVQKPSLVGNIISWAFGLLAVAIGIINLFWGNDQGYGLFVILLALVYFPPITAMVKQFVGFSIPSVLKILLALFIIWSAVGVGELFIKIDMMLEG